MCPSLYLWLCFHQSHHKLSLPTTQTGADTGPTPSVIMRSFLAGVLLLMLPFLALGFVPRLPSKCLATKVSAAPTWGEAAVQGREKREQ